MKLFFILIILNFNFVNASILEGKAIQTNEINNYFFINRSPPVLSNNIIASELISFKNMVVSKLETSYGYQSCLKILNLDLSEGDKSYLIDFDGLNNGKNPQQVFCI